MKEDQRRHTTRRLVLARRQGCLASRRRCNAAPLVVRATDEGVEILQPGEAIPAAQVTFEAISYSDAGDVILQGRGAAGEDVVLYVDDEPAADARVDAEGQWRIVLSFLPEGLYTLRADQIGEDGAVTSRAETPFQRVILPVALPDPAPEPEPAESAGDETLASAAPAEAPAEDTAAPGIVEEPAADAVAEATAEAEQSTEEPQMADATTSEGADSESAPATALAAPPRPSQIVVQPGNNLWTIARQRYGDGFLYTQIFAANSDQIRDPDLIYPGQVFVLPQGEGE
ncbi:MAG: LysM peptidoglycan-binding domain-containing protein [Rubricella sp.]